MKKLLFILEAGDIYPSGYVRGIIYRDLFIENGFEVRYVSRCVVFLVRAGVNARKLFPGATGEFIARFLNIIHRPASYFKALYLARIAAKYDIVYMLKLMESAFVERLRRRTRSYLVYDFGDAMWRDGSVGLNKILSRVDAVVAVNEYVASYAKKFNRNCTVVPDPSQIEEFDKMRPRIEKDGNRVTLGWVGTESSFCSFLLLHDVLEYLFSKYDKLHLRLLGVKDVKGLEKTRYTTLPDYDQSDMIREVLKMDIGLFPLHDDEPSLSRGMLKATVYMSGEAAVICSPVGECNAIVQDGVNGMLAGTGEEWKAKLELLIADAALRKKIAEKGLETVRGRYGLKQTFEKLLSVLEKKDCAE